jgi:8-oxo-dGTP diphosphatase
VRIHVLVGLVADSSGRLLISQRRASKHMAGAWEFPGGKKRDDETRLEALARELAEELGITVERAEPLLELVHDYPDRQVKLDVWLVREYGGEPAGLEGQPLRWVEVAALGEVGLLEADRPIVNALRAMQER